MPAYTVGGNYSKSPLIFFNNLPSENDYSSLSMVI